MPSDDVAGRYGPLVGSELARATEVLTDRQLQAYRLRREGHAWNWIAHRMGVSRQAVIHHVAKAEGRLGYEQTVTSRKKGRYKPAAERRAEEDERNLAAWQEFLDQIDPLDKLYVLKLIRASESDPQAEERLLRRLQHLQRRYATVDNGEVDDPNADDWSSAVGENEAEFAENLREMGVESADQLVPD